MGNRLSKIYTRTGDDGTTALANGERLSKSDAVFAVMGDMDELNAHVGLIRALLDADENNNNKTNNQSKTKSTLADIGDTLSKIQHLLFNIGGELAMPEFEAIDTQRVAWLEGEIDAMNAHLEPLKDFILPAGSQTIAQIHIARTICRRAERSSLQLPNMRATTLQFLNRLSDYLFVLARYCAKLTNVDEVLWDKQWDN